jgi:hypothetical protein
VNLIFHRVLPALLVAASIQPARAQAVRRVTLPGKVKLGTFGNQQGLFRIRPEDPGAGFWLLEPGTARVLNKGTYYFEFLPGSGRDQEYRCTLYLTSYEKTLAFPDDAVCVIDVAGRGDTLNGAGRYVNLEGKVAIDNAAGPGEDWLTFR